MKKLTKNQAKALAGMLQFAFDNNCLPTTTWVSGFMGVQNATPMLNRMADKGYISREFNRWRLLRRTDGTPIEFRFVPVNLGPGLILPKERRESS